MDAIYDTGCVLVGCVIDCLFAVSNVLHCNKGRKSGLFITRDSFFGVYLNWNWRSEYVRGEKLT